MTGPFGGTLAHADGATLESLSPALSTALASAFTSSQSLPTDGPGAPTDAARVLWFEPDPSGIRYDGDIAGTRPLHTAGWATGAMLTALARVARRLEHLHAQGVIHGDVRPDMVRVGDDGDVLLLVPARRSSVGSVLRARLQHGAAEPTVVGFSAPEIAAGFEATPASDAYGLAATAHAALSGYAPLGQLGLRGGLDPMGMLASGVTSALAQTPSQRTSLSHLASVLDRAAIVAAKAPASAGPYRTAPGVSSAAEAVATRARTEEMSAVLVLVLILGGLIAFAGAVLLVVAGWDVVGEFGRVVMMAALSGASFGAGSLAARKSLPAAATALRGVGALFGVVAAGYGFYLLGDNERLLFMVALAGGAFGGGLYAEEHGAPTAGAALVALGTQLLWAVGGLWMFNTHSTGSGSFTLVAGFVTAVTYGLALARRSTLLGALAALDYAAFAISLGVLLSTGTVTGPAVYTLLVALGYAALASGAALRSSDGTGTAMATGALLTAWLSAALGIAVLSHDSDADGTRYVIFGGLWPFVIAAPAGVFAQRARAPYASIASTATLGVIFVAPTVQSLVHPGLLFTLSAVLVGACVLLAAFFHPRVARDEGVQFGGVLAGLAGTIAAPVLSYLRASDGGDRPGGELYLGLITLVTIALLGLSYMASARGSRKNAWRAVEAAALAQFFGVFTLRTLQDQRAWAYPVGVILAALVVLALGRGTRRLVPTLGAGVTLVVNLWIQYFVRLSDVLPISVLLVGFGIGLLVMGVLYEQNVKRRLPALREWS